MSANRNITVLVDGHIFGAYPRGGIARYFREVMPRIASRNPNIRFLLLCDERALPFVPEHPQIQLLCFHPFHHRPARLFSPVNAMRKRLFDRRAVRLRPQVFHSTYYTMPPFGGMRTVATVYDLIDDQLPFLQPNGPGFVEHQRQCLTSADRVVSISKATADLAVERLGIDPAKIATTHLDASPVFVPASDAEQAGFRRRHTGGRPFVLFVGTVGGYKNLAVLVRALGQLRECTNHVLLVAGHETRPLDGWLTDLAIRERVEERIIRQVHPSDEELRLAYASADVFVYPSLAEGFGIPLVEAMRCRTPVIASDIPVFHEVCGDAALFFDAHNPAELAECLLEVFQPNTAEALRARGIARAEAFSWDRTAADLERVYLELACGV